MKAISSLAFGLGSALLCFASVASADDYPAQPAELPPSFGGPRPPPPGYGAPPPAYGSPPPGYGAPPPGYAPAYPPPGYGPPQTYGYAYAAPPELRRRSVGMMAGGVVLTVIGAGALLTSSILATTALFDTTDSRAGAELGLLIAGGVALGVGIPLLVYGAKKVPAAPEAALMQPNSWHGAPGGRGWQWKF